MLGSDVKIHLVRIVLAQGNVDACLWWFAEGLIVDGLHNSDHIQKLLAARQLQALAECTLVGPIFVSHGVVNDCDRGRNLTVIRSEVAAFQQRYSESGEIIEIDGIHNGGDGVRFRQLLPAFDDYADPLASPQRQLDAYVAETMPGRRPMRSRADL